MIQINGGRRFLYQWDLNQKLILYDVYDEVHFSHKGDESASVLIPYEKDGKYVVDIPNVYLQSAEPLQVYLYNVAAEESNTVAHCEIRVCPREKPSGYVYTETEVLAWEDLAERIGLVEKTAEGYAKKEDVEGAILAVSTHGETYNETDVVFSEDGFKLDSQGKYTFNGSLMPNIDKKYVFLLDREVYTLYPQLIRINGVSRPRVVLGNPYLFSKDYDTVRTYDDNGQSFYMVHALDKSTISFKMTDDNGDFHFFKLIQGDYSRVNLPLKFIPYLIPTEKRVEQKIEEKAQDINAGVDEKIKNISFYGLKDVPLSKEENFEELTIYRKTDTQVAFVEQATRSNTPYTVIYDGVEYPITSKTQSLSGGIIYYLGNISLVKSSYGDEEDKKYPFCFYCQMPGGDSYAFTIKHGDTNVSHTYELYGEKTVTYTTMPTFLLPMEEIKAYVLKGIVDGNEVAY